MIAVMNSILEMPAGRHRCSHKIDIMIAAKHSRTQPSAMTYLNWLQHTLHCQSTPTARPICYWLHLFVYILLIQNLRMLEEVIGHRSSRTVICLAWLLRATRFFLRNETLFYIIFYFRKRWWICLCEMVTQSVTCNRRQHWRRLLFRFLVAWSHLQFEDGK